MMLRANKDLILANDVAKPLGVHIRTARRMAARGELGPTVQVGRHIWVTRAFVENLLEPTGIHTSEGGLR